jgi:ATP-binding protein involved in chromosome partitioning
MADREAALAALNRLIDPKSGKGLADAGLVLGLVAQDGRVGFAMEVLGEDVPLYTPIRDAAEAVLKALPGVTRVHVVLTSEEPPLAPGATRVRRGAKVSPELDGPPKGRPPEATRPPHVAHVIAVSSGKGGVGKSTVAVNLACALAALGQRVGLMDADVYGPSIPRMTGVSDDPTFGPDKKLQPIEAWGLKIMSIGLIIDEDQAAIWRGPMASSAVRQFLGDVAWGTEEDPMDVLVIDFPPGTGDVQLTLSQRVAFDGAVIVTTPQEVALIDVRRGATMFRKTEVPILGVVENMAYFPDPTTGAAIPIFGRGGGERVAKELRVPFLGEIPIDMALRQACDDGKPLVVQAPDTPAAQAFMAIARTVLKSIASEVSAPPA